MLKVGEYVRTDKGNIAKLIERDIEDEDVKDGMLFDNYIYKNYKHIRESGIRKCCKKHSKNIIDLIEVGDYVNGMLVTTIINMDENSNYIPLRIILCNRDGDCTLPLLKIYEKDIKSIVTKEIIKANEYRIE